MASPKQLEFHFPAVVMSRGDGSFVIKPGKPVVLDEEISAEQAAQILRRSVFTVYRYVKEGLLDARQTKPGARVRVFRDQVFALAKRAPSDED